MSFLVHLSEADHDIEENPAHEVRYTDAGFFWRFVNYYIAGESPRKQARAYGLTCEEPVNRKRFSIWSSMFAKRL